MAEADVSAGAKRPYVTPVLEEVRLVGEESVLVSCRYGLGSPPDVGNSGTCSPLPLCYIAASQE